MPRRVVPPTIAAPLPPPPLSPLVQKLRQDWRWAGISQFVYTFSDAFGLVDWDIESLEKDLDGAEEFVLPDLISKLLVALTWNRQINRQNAFENLRKQYLKRAPDHNPLGTLEEPIEWPTLGLDQKVGIIWQLCEWQLVDPARFRSLLKNEDDPASWRVDPVGWDKQGNTYFLFDDNRLWIQRARPLPPRPQKKSSPKAKKAQRAQRKANPPPKRSHKKREAPAPAPAPVPAPVAQSPPATPPVPLLDASPIMTGSRKRKQVVFYGNVVSTVEALKRGGPAPTPTRSERATRRSSGRAPVASPTKPAPPLPLGTRVSRRLRPVADDWQQVPKEWLNGSSSRSKATDGDDDSELSDLTDEETHEAIVQATFGSPVKDEPMVKSDSPLSEASAPKSDPVVDEPEPEPVVEEAKDEPMDEDKDEEDEAASEEEPEVEEEEEEPEPDEFEEGLKHAKDLPEGFIEWETTFPEQFAKSKHPDEKALYRILTDDVGPQIIEVLEAKEIERLKQEAINNRKRSSRIATRDLERAEFARREQAERDMEERMERLRQEEERKAREEEEALEAQRAREARLKEREERIAARKQAITDRAEADAHEREKAERKRERRKRRRDGEEVETSSDEEQSAVQTPATTGSGQNSWELKCEVCKQHGWNLKDTDDLVGCDDCGRWQHVACHDKQDVAAGRNVRDWDKVDFRCKECEDRADAKRRKIEEPSSPSAPQVPQVQPQPTALPVQQLPPAGQVPLSHPVGDHRPVTVDGPPQGFSQTPVYANGHAGEHRPIPQEPYVAPVPHFQHPAAPSAPHVTPAAHSQQPGALYPSVRPVHPPSHLAHTGPLHPLHLTQAPPPPGHSATAPTGHLTQPPPSHPAQPPPQAYPQRPVYAQPPPVPPPAAVPQPQPQALPPHHPAPQPPRSTHVQPGVPPEAQPRPMHSGMGEMRVAPLPAPQPIHPQSDNGVNAAVPPRPTSPHAGVTTQTGPNQ